MATSELLPQVGEFLGKHPETDSLNPLDDSAHTLVWAVGDQEVEMIACHLPEKNRQFMFHRNLAEGIANTEGHRPDKDGFAVLRDP